MNFNKSLTWLPASAIIILGATVMFGWKIHSVRITQIHSNFAAMQFNTAVCFVLAGLSIVFLQIRKIMASRILTILLSAICLPTLMQYILDLDFGIDLLFNNSSITAHASYPGRMSPVTATVFTLSSLVLFISSIASPSKKITMFLGYASLGIFCVGAISITGYLTGLNLVDGWHSYIQVAAHTGIGFCFLGSSIFFNSQPQAQPQLQLLTVFTLIIFLLLAPVIADSKKELALLGILFVLFGFNILLLRKSLIQIEEQQVDLTRGAIELNKVHNSLKSTTEFLEQTSRMAKVGGWELEIDTGKVSVTKEAEVILEINHNDASLLDIAADRWYPANTWPIVKGAVESAINHGISYDLETPFITAKGNNIVVRTQGFPVIVAGKVTHLRGTFQDITERKQIEVKDQFIGEAFGFGVWKFYSPTNVLEWDDKMYELYDINPKDFLGAFDAWENSLSEKTKADAMKELELALSGEKDFNTEFEIILKNGESRYIAGRAIVIRNEKKEPIKVYGLNWDVTKRIHKELELKAANLKLIQSSKLASLGEMSASIAHEINNPLTVISGAVQLLSNFSDNPEKFNSKIESIKKSCARIEKIVGGLKKFSRSSGEAILKNHKIIDIANEVMILTEPKSKKTNTSVTLNCTTQNQILCDEVEIEQVLVNLINNAIDAVENLPQKWVEVSIFEEASHIVLHVKDSGQGIPSKFHSKLFDPFFTTKNVGAGTGLGLAITKGILDEHKASISLLLDSAHTCFEVRFPITKAS